MAGFPKKDRQKIIDGYLAETGNNMFVPGDFIDWLEGKPDHVAYPWFFSKDDAAAAREYRVALARQMANGLRIVARASDGSKTANIIGVSVREYPAFVSPMDGRKHGGGYVGFDPDDPSSVAELQRQGLVSLKSWFSRYGGVFGDTGQVIYDLIEALEDQDAA